MGLGLGVMAVKSDWDKLQDKLNQQQQTLNALKPTVFQAINEGKPLAVIDYLVDNPLLALIKDDAHGSSVLQAAIFNLANTAEPEKRAQFIQLINHIIDNTPFDVRVSNKDGSTALHQIFWYAIMKPQNDPAFRKQLIDIGLKLIEHIKGSSNFLAIMSQQNKHNETFLANIDVAPQHAWQQENMKAVQEVVYPVLQKYAVKDIKNAETNYNFITGTFEEYLEEILKDPITLDTMEVPLLLTTSGHSISKDSWDHIVQTAKENFSLATTFSNPITKAPTAEHEVYLNKPLQQVINIYNKYKQAGSEKLLEELSKYLKKYEGPAKSLVYNDLALRGVISLVSQYTHFKEAELQKKQQEELKKQEELQKQQQKPKVPQYQFIDWMASSSPAAVTNHPLWTFHQALAHTKSTAQDFDKKQYWALASIKSLIEIDLNREFVVEAGLAYERDLDNGIYVAQAEDMHVKKPGAVAEFDAFRNATQGNAQGGDSQKADTLRTSKMRVAPNGKTDFVSYHPSLSYPTSNFLIEERRARKEQQIDYFYNGLLQIWKRIDALPSTESKQKCLNTFCQHVKIAGIGCANERLGDAIDKVTQELIQHEEKQITEMQLLTAIEPVMGALGEPPQGDPHELFEQLLKHYSGYTLQGATWVIGDDTKKQLAEKIIDLGIKVLGILDEGQEATYLAKFGIGQAQPKITPQQQQDNLLGLLKQKKFVEAVDMIKSDLSLRDVTFANHFGASPMSMAAIAGNYAAVHALIQLKANVNLKDGNNNIPLSWVILEAGKVKQKNSSDPLLAEYKKIALLLIEHGSDMKNEDKSGYTPLDLVKQYMPEWQADVLPKKENPEQLKQQQEEMLKQQQEEVVKKEKEQYQQSVARAIAKIDETLNTLRTNIGQTHQHPLSAAVRKATELLDRLKGCRDRYREAMLQEPRPDAEITGQQFITECGVAIDDAKQVLKRDLDWGDYLGNMLKALMNAVIGIGTTNPNSFFAYKKPDSVDAVEAAAQNLKPDFP